MLLGRVVIILPEIDKYFRFESIFELRRVYNQSVLNSSISISRCEIMVELLNAETNLYVTTF